MLQKNVYMHTMGDNLLEMMLSDERLYSVCTNNVVSRPTLFFNIKKLKSMPSS